MRKQSRLGTMLAVLLSAGLYGLAHIPSHPHDGHTALRLQLASAVDPIDAGDAAGNAVTESRLLRMAKSANTTTTTAAPPPPAPAPPATAAPKPKKAKASIVAKRATPVVAP